MIKHSRQLPMTLLIAGTGLLYCAETAQAHPHLWIITKATVLYENGAFVGLRQTWSFDKAYSTIAVEEMHKKEDGTYDPAELAELAKVNIEGMREVSYFTVVQLSGHKLDLGDARDYRHEFKDGALLLYFTVPFVQPVPAGAKGFNFSISDPEYYIAFEFDRIDPVKLEGAPPSCKPTIQTRATPSLFGMIESKAVSVACGSP
jgi:ABC-type uncharacterized transport system substrate-binding protein